MKFDDFIFLLAIGLACGLLAISINWLLKWDYRKRGGVHQNRMHVPTGLVLFYSIFGAAGVLIASAAILDLEVWSDPDRWLVLVFLAPGIALLWLAVEHRVRRLAWDSRGVRIGQLNQPEAFYAWQQVVRIDYMFFTEACRLWFDDGRRFHLPERMVGLDAFMIDAVRHPHIELRDSRLIAMRDSNSTE